MVTEGTPHTPATSPLEVQALYKIVNLIGAAVHLDTTLASILKVLHDTLRMERALDLLEDDTLSIQDVAEKVGYNGISNFYAVFRQTFGDTPAAIQKLLETK